MGGLSFIEGDSLSRVPPESVSKILGMLFGGYSTREIGEALRLSSTIVSNVARAMYRVLKLGGLVALLFDGKLSDREVGDVVFRVASRHPEYPAFIESVKAFHKGFIDLE